MLVDGYTPGAPDFQPGHGINRPLLQSDSDLVFALASPDAMNHKAGELQPFSHINKDFRTSNLTPADEASVDAAMSAFNAGSWLGENSVARDTVLHSAFIDLNIPVSRKGKGLDLLVTRKQAQRQDVTTQSKNFMSRSNGDDTGGY